MRRNEVPVRARAIAPVRRHPGIVGIADAADVAIASSLNSTRPKNCATWLRRLETASKPCVATAPASTACINDPFRICFRWTAQGPAEVAIVDCHR